MVRTIVTRIRVAFLALLLGGCIPDLSAWYIAAEGDGSVQPVRDGGSGEPNPIELGPACPNPHLMVGTVGGTSEIARLLRFDPATDVRCRDSALIETQRAFGYAIHDVAWHPDTGVVLGLSDAVLGLDAEGFPAWRSQRFERDMLRGEWVAAFGTGVDARVAVAWNERTTALDRLRLLDSRGIQTSGEIEPSFSGPSMIAAHPAGDGRLLMISRSGPELDVFEVDDATTRLRDQDAAPLWSGGEDLTASFGPRVHVDTDLETRRVAITHHQGVAVWRLGATPPTTAASCPSYCESFHAATLAPEVGVYAICAAGSDRHLVHLSESSCTLVLDGTSLGSLRLQDVALVRSAL